LGELSAFGQLFILGSFFENFRSRAIFLGHLFHAESYALILKKYLPGYIFGDFLGKPSGRPGSDANLIRQERIYCL
jgi:hypothetical protein